MQNELARYDAYLWQPDDVAVCGFGTVCLELQSEVSEGATAGKQAHANMLRYQLSSPLKCMQCKP